MIKELKISRRKPFDIDDRQVDIIFKYIILNYRKGYWEIAIDDLKNMLELPTDLSKTDVQYRVLEPINDIIRKKPLFSELKCYSLWSKKNSFTTFIFQW